MMDFSFLYIKTGEWVFFFFNFIFTVPSAEDSQLEIEVIEKGTENSTSSTN